MSIDTRDPETALEFVHVTTASELRECRRLAATLGVSSAGIVGAFWWDDGAEPSELQHVFLLRHRGEAVATLCVHEPAAAAQRPRLRSGALRGMAARDRDGAGCSYRLLLLLWSTQWLAAHRWLRNLMAVCRTDALHRYTPLGFTTAGRWFHAGGAGGHSCVAISATASQVIETGRELGLVQVLESAQTAADGRGLLSGLMPTAA